MTPSVEILQQPLKLDKTTPLHFIGIGGVGMSGLAKVLAESGYQVSGSDLAENAYTQQVAAAGAKVFKGHEAGNVPANAQIIVSSSIDESNPEIAQARTRNLEIHHRSSLLRELMNAHETQVGITGTHGKTTITGMTGVALRAAGINPSVIVGGKMPGLDTNAVLDENYKTIVAELDESDGTILQYQPTLSVIANLELDHADHFTNGLEGVLETFRTYVSKLPMESKVLYNVTCPQVKKMAEQNPIHVEPILLAPGDVFTGDEVSTTYWLKNARHHGHGCYQGYVYKNKRLLGELHMTVPGRHNLFNGLCAIAVGDQLDADFDEMAAALREFTGMGRRFEKVGEYNKAMLIDDYAHHPSEVAATLKAARESLHGGSGRLIAIFQPHRYTRLQALWNEFCACFGDADIVYITDVYSAHEPVIEGMTAEAFAKSVQHANVKYLPLDSDFAALKAEIQGLAQPADLVISMGAGNITQLLRNW